MSDPVREAAAKVAARFDCAETLIMNHMLGASAPPCGKCVFCELRRALDAPEPVPTSIVQHGATTVMGQPASRIALDGLIVSLYRSEMDGQLVIDLDSTDLAEADTVNPDACPKVRIYVNEARVFDEGRPVPEEEWAP